MEREKYSEVEIFKDEKGDLFLNLKEVAIAALKSPCKLDVVAAIIAQPEFGKALEELVKGYSDHEWQGWGLVRFGMVRSGEIRYGKVRCGEAWQERRGTAWRGQVC